MAEISREEYNRQFAILDNLAPEIRSRFSNGSIYAPDNWQRVQEVVADEPVIVLDYNGVLAGTSGPLNFNQEALTAVRMFKAAGVKTVLWSMAKIAHFAHIFATYNSPDLNLSELFDLVIASENYTGSNTIATAAGSDQGYIHTQQQRELVGQVPWLQTSPAITAFYQSKLEEYHKETLLMFRNSVLIDDAASMMGRAYQHFAWTGAGLHRQPSFFEKIKLAKEGSEFTNISVQVHSWPRYELPGDKNLSFFGPELVVPVLNLLQET